MRLNADVIFAHLSRSFDAELLGTPGKELALPRPVFYMEPDDRFAANRLYLASADHLPAHPFIEKGAVIVCVGESMQLAAYVRHCTVIRVRGKVDFFEVYLAIQAIFDRFDAWNDELFELFKADADMGRIVSCSVPVFSNPLIVINGDFHIIASADTPERRLATLWKDAGGNLSQYSMQHFLERSDLRVEEHGAMFLKVVDSNALCVNLFDAGNRYMGCLCVVMADDEPPRGMDALAQHLARIIEHSLTRNPALLNTDHSMRKNILANLVSGTPLSPSQRWTLENAPGEHAFACVSLHSLGAERQLPAAFVCNSFELAFPGSYSFPAGTGAVGIVDLAALGAAHADARTVLADALDALTGSLKLCAGVSNAYAHLADTPVYLRQAESALSHGGFASLQDRCFFFMDYALEELVVNALSGAPIESYFTDGLKRLIEHDRTSAVSYLETLRMVLAQGMNCSRAADALYIHRSTLVDRINKMEQVFGIDLHDADTRLYLQIILKGLDTLESLKARA